MSTLQFSRWIALVGVFAGMMIALIVPVAVLMVGADLTANAQLIIIVLALLIGGCVAAAAVVVGITIPTAVVGGAIKITEDGVRFDSIADCCAPRTGADHSADDPAASETR